MKKKKVQFNLEQEFHEDVCTIPSGPLDVSSSSSSSSSSLERVNKSVLWYTKADIDNDQTSQSHEENDEHDLRRNRKNDVRQFVLNLLKQQQEHKSLGIVDAKGLFQFSKACSKNARQRALKAGKQHAVEVEMSWEERRQDTLNTLDDALALLEL